MSRRSTTSPPATDRARVWLGVGILTAYPTAQNRTRTGPKKKKKTWPPQRFTPCRVRALATRWYVLVVAPPTPPRSIGNATSRRREQWIRSIPRMVGMACTGYDPTSGRCHHSPGVACSDDARACTCTCWMVRFVRSRELVVVPACQEIAKLARSRK